MMSTPSGMRPRPAELILAGLAEEFQISLTPAARALLLLPLQEIEAELGPLDLAQVQKSLRTLVGTIHDSPDAFARKKPWTRGPISVIKAFWKNFCDIPPFCGPTEESHGGTEQSKRPR